MKQNSQYRQGKIRDKNLEGSKWDHDGFDEIYRRGYKQSRFSNSQQESSRNSEYNYIKKQDLQPIQRDQPGYRHYQSREQKERKPYYNKTDRNSEDTSASEFKHNDLQQEEKLSNISLNSTEKNIRPMLEEFQDKSHNFFSTRQDISFNTNFIHLFDCILHFPTESERLQIVSFGDYDSIMEKICQKHNLDVLMTLSLKIMILKQYLEQNPNEKNNLIYLTDSYFERFHKLINQDKWMHSIQSVSHKEIIS